MFFVAAIVTCFLDPIAMAVLFALVTGLTIWEYTGLVNEHVENTTVNRSICTVAGVFLFLAVYGYCCHRDSRWHLNYGIKRILSI